MVEDLLRLDNEIDYIIRALSVVIFSLYYVTSTLEKRNNHKRQI